MQGFRQALSPEDCLLVSDPMNPGLPLPASRLTASDEAWDVHPALPLDDSWHGATVAALRDGRIVGVLLSTQHDAKIFPIPNIFE